MPSFAACSRWLSVRRRVWPAGKPASTSDAAEAVRRHMGQSYVEQHLTLAELADVYTWAKK
jgi:hypothetical protein